MCSYGKKRLGVSEILYDNFMHTLFITIFGELGRFGSPSRVGDFAKFDTGGDDVFLVAMNLA